MRLWIKAPLAILAKEASGGLVVEGGRIVELLPAGAAPAAPVDETFDASEHVRCDLLNYLAELRGCGFSLVLVSSSPLREAASLQLHEICDAVLERSNSGYDFGAWQEAMATLGLPRPGAECLLLVNDSLFGPFAPLRGILDGIDFRHAEIWGLTESLEIRHHLQSYFLAFGPAALSSSAWHDFWRSFHPASSRMKTIRNGEVGLACHLERAGLRTAALFPFTPASAVNPCIVRWRELLAAGYPFVKRELLRDNPAADPAVASWREQVEACFGGAGGFLLAGIAGELAGLAPVLRRP